MNRKERWRAWHIRTSSCCRVEVYPIEWGWMGYSATGVSGRCGRKKVCCPGETEKEKLHPAWKRNAAASLTGLPAPSHESAHPQH